jgi:transcriptional regulator with XRE-family HTH domain
VGDKESLGKYLQRERETRKISLRRVADHTRVREQFLKAIEEDQFHLLPSGTYVKGFLLAYAKYIGLDPNEVLLRYESLLKLEPGGEKEVLPERKISKISWNMKYLIAIGGAIALSLIAVYYFFYLAKPSVESIPVKPKSETKETLAPVLPLKTSEIASPPEEKSFSLQLKAVERTWVRFQVDSQPEQEILFKPGENILLKGLKQIRLIVGNAGGLDLIFKGKTLERFGKSGEVVTLTFTPQGVEVEPHEKPNT